MLAEYLKYFDTVEINNSFYRLPEDTTFEEWRKQTPNDFVFAVKASRFLTHQKKLNDPEEPLERMLSRMSALEKKLGVVLVQLPPRWQINLDRLEHFLKLLPKDVRFTVEFRDHSWHVPKTYALLKKYNVAFCIYHLAGFQSPIEITADFVYVRLHGPSDQAYWGSYSKRQLRTWADRIELWKKKSKAVYIYFDNDPEAFAPYNALELKSLLGEKVILPDKASLVRRTLFD